jgi:V/A-type H+-transporting ATPase subunit K
VKVFLLAVVVLMGVCLLTPMALAADEDGGEAAAGGGSNGIGLGIGAGLAVGLAGLGTGLAQSGVGSGGTGAMAEKPELFTNVLILFAIPETIVILGFVIAFLSINAI